jgi:lipopolysaccharide heptosyltransferase II
MAEQAAGVAESAPALEVESEPEPWRSDDPNRDEAVVIQTGSLAEVILTTPLIASAAQRGPVDVVVRGAVADVLESNPAIRRVFRYERSAEDLTDLTALWRTLRAVRGRRTAGESERRSGRERRARRIAYVADSSMRSALLALFADVDERVGFATAPGRALYTRRVPFLEDQHHAGRLLALAAADEDPRPAPEVLRPRLFPSAADVAAVDALLGAAADDRAPLVALAVGAGRATRRWPLFAELGARLGRRARLAIVGSRDDTTYAAAVSAAAGVGRAIDATGRLSVLASAELIRRAVVLVANDSTPVHLASAMGTPTLTIYGPTVPEFGFRPLAPRSHVLGHPALRCRPCDRRGPSRCPLGHWRCMREISADDVDRLIDESTLYPRT